MMDLPKTHWIETEHYGLLGKPLRKSLSPKIYNANFEAMDINAVYYPIEVEEKDLPVVMPAFAHLKYKGLNVTMPLKKAVIPFLDELDEMGRLCGAVNTIAIRDGRYIGTNTDGTGFVHSLKEQGGFAPASKECVIFGAGGAGRGISFALANEGVSRITMIDVPQAEAMMGALVSELNAYRSGIARGALLGSDAALSATRAADLVVNATPVGMTPNEDSVICDISLMDERQTVCDIVYVPHRTKFLDGAESRGCRTLEGYWMLIWQAVEAFRFWTGREPDVEVMRRAVVDSVVG